MIVVVQIFHKIGFSTLGYPTHLWLWNDLYKDHIGFIYYFNPLLLSYNDSAHKDQNQDWFVIGNVNVQ